MSFDAFQFANKNNITKNTKTKYWMAVLNSQLNDLTINREVVVEIMNTSKNELIYTGVGIIKNRQENKKQFQKQLDQINNNDSETIKLEKILQASKLIKLENVEIELKPFNIETIQFGFKSVNNMKQCQESCILKLKPKPEKTIGGLVQVVPFSISKGDKKLRALIYIGCDVKLGECFKKIV